MNSILWSTSFGEAQEDGHTGRLCSFFATLLNTRNPFKAKKQEQYTTMGLYRGQWGTVWLRLQAGATSQAPPTETFVLCFLCQDPCSWNSTCCCSHFCPDASWRWGCQLRPRVYLDADIHQAQPGKLASWGFMSPLLNSSSAVVILLEHPQSVLWPGWEEVNAFKTSKQEAEAGVHHELGATLSSIVDSCQSGLEWSPTRIKQQQSVNRELQIRNVHIRAHCRLVANFKVSF